MKRRKKKREREKEKKTEEEDQPQPLGFGSAPGRSWDRIILVHSSPLLLLLARYRSNGRTHIWLRVGSLDENMVTTN